MLIIRFHIGDMRIYNLLSAEIKSYYAHEQSTRRQARPDPLELCEGSSMRSISRAADVSINDRLDNDDLTIASFTWHIAPERQSIYRRLVSPEAASEYNQMANLLQIRCRLHKG